MLEIAATVLGVASVVLGFVYWFLKVLFVSKEDLSRQKQALEDKVKGIEDAIVRRSLETLEQHNKLASKAELKELETAFNATIDKIDRSNKDLSEKISSVQNGLYWLVARAGGKDDVLERLFKKD
jgi:cell division protein FtsB